MKTKFNSYTEFLNEGNEEYIEISTKIFKKFHTLLKREKRELMDLWKKGLHSTEDPRFNPYERWWGFTDQKQVEGVWGPFTEKPGDMFGLEFETLDEMEADFRGYAEVDTYQVVVIPLRMEILFHYSDNGENDIPEGTRARFEKCLDEAIKSIPASKIEKYKGRIGAKRLGLLENTPSGSWVDDEMVEKLDGDLHVDIVDYINAELWNWSSGLENADSEAEAEAIQAFGENSRMLDYWRVYDDGTLSAVVKLVNGSGKLSDFDLEDDDGNPVGNFLNVLNGTVRHEFDEKATTGDNKLSKDLEERVKDLFSRKRGAIGGHKAGLL